MFQALRDLGLDAYEAKTYVALVRCGISTSGMISKESGVPYGKIYPVLYSLAKKGYIKEYEGRPKRFMAVEPSVILNSELDRKGAELATLKSGIGSLIEEIDKVQKPAEPLERVQVIQGKRNYLNLSVKLHKKALSEYRSISRLPIYRPHLDAYSQMSKRGVNARVLTAQKNREIIAMWQDAGVNIRRIKAPDIRYTLVDRSDAVIRIGESDDSGYVALWIQNPALADILAQNFDKQWETAETI